MAAGPGGTPPPPLFTGVTGEVEGVLVGTGVEPGTVLVGDGAGDVLVGVGPGTVFVGVGAWTVSVGVGGTEVSVGVGGGCCANEEACAP